MEKEVDRGQYFLGLICDLAASEAEAEDSRCVCA